METTVLERIRMHFVPTQLWQSLRQQSETVCASQSKESISVWRVLVMVHILQSISSAPRVTVNPKSRDLGSFLFRGKQFGCSSFHWRSSRREQTCECPLSVPALRCWSSPCWLKAALPPEEFCATLVSGIWERSWFHRELPRWNVLCVLEEAGEGSSPSLAQTSDVLSWRTECLT